MRAFEETLYAEDRRFLDWKKYRNDLEAYSYEMRDNLGEYGSFEKYVDPSTKAMFLEEINTTVEWLYGEGEKASLKEYQERLMRFKRTGEPIKSRAKFYSTLPELKQ